MPTNQIPADAEARIAAQPEDKQPIYRACLEAMRKARTELEQQASAKWWIEHRAEIYPIDQYVRAAGNQAGKVSAQAAQEVA